MKYKIVHKTIYEYSEQAALSQNDLCLFPRETPRQIIGARELAILPQPSVMDHRTDFFGNHIHNFMVQQPHRKLEIMAQSFVETIHGDIPEPSSTLPWEAVMDALSRHGDQESLNAYAFIFPSPFVYRLPDFVEYAKGSFLPGRPVLESALDLTKRIYTDFSYEKEATDIGTPLEKIFKAKKGVCQDFAHVEIACLRSLGLAARYISGYLETIAPPGKPKMVGADASHAWLALHVPGIGWIDLDPTNNMVPDERHITVAWGRDYGDVTPVKGIVWGGGLHKMSVSVDVAPV